MIYNQKEHEQLKEQIKTKPWLALVLLDREHKRDAFVQGIERWIYD